MAKARSHNEHIDLFFVYGFSLCFVIILSLTAKIMTLTGHFFSQKTSPQKVQEQVVVPLIFNKEAFSSVVVEGRAYVVYDLISHEVIAGKNEQEMLPLASLTKVMTALTAKIHYPVDKKVVITPDNIDGGFDLGLRNKQSWSLTELLKYTLVFSSNDGAEAIADNFGSQDLFIKTMNDDARTLGLNLTFTDPAGLDHGSSLGGKGSALDVAKLLGIAKEAIPEVLDATTKKRQTVLSGSGRVSGVPNTNQHIESFPGAEASKTGFTDLAGGNLGVIVDVSVGHPVAIVVLGSTRQGRFVDVENLYKALMSSFSFHK